jgi:predicted O-methyltransferase YrrM
VSGSVADALDAVRDVEGWMTDAQARRLWQCAAAIPADGHALEIGSFRGRSTIMLARAAPEDARVTAVDPHAGGDRGPQEIQPDRELGESDHAAFHANLARAGVAARVRHVRLPSADALAEVPGELDLLYVDGAHRYGLARDDIARWGARVKPGGRMLIHDAFSSVGVTLAICRVVLGPRSGWRYAGRSRSLAEYVREPGGARHTLRQLAQLPWFARNVVVKALIVLRLRKGSWPY